MAGKSPIHNRRDGFPGCNQYEQKKGYPCPRGLTEKEKAATEVWQG